MSRLFVAMVLPLPAIAALERDVAAVRTKAWRWVPPERWHVTLEFVGEADAEEVTRRWASRVRHTAPMRLRIAGAGAFPVARRGRVLWAGLAGDIGAWQRLAGDDQQPHLTIARSNRPVDMTGAVTALATHHGPSWTATEAVLFDSQPSRAAEGGSTYTVAARFPLGAGPTGRSPDTVVR
ncbi:MAG: RNA 2',3'-cyclic phosphodiesterase [Ilumatobacteraceae bacterium]